jgi:superoxide dismutase, Fe-Mn family
MADNRRDFIKKSSLLALAGLAGELLAKTGLDKHTLSTVAGENDQLPPLPYAYDALEPHIDKQTMLIHHTKHHQAYIDKLKTAPAEEFTLSKSLEDNCRKVDEKTSALTRNNLGGHYNHSFFWPLLMPNPTGKENKPTGKLAEAIDADFGSFENFKTQFTDRATRIFGSGWCWLVAGPPNPLRITTTANQDNPLMRLKGDTGKPLLALDVWEHAYYLKYQNKRADYINAWWNIVNWQKAEELYVAAIK